MDEVVSRNAASKSSQPKKLGIDIYATDSRGREN
jgi:hypothetical protein